MAVGLKYLAGLISAEIADARILFVVAKVLVVLS